MAKIKCRSCGKMFSDVEVFCPKCGYPAESSSGPVRVGGRPATGSAVRRINRSADSMFDDEKKSTYRASGLGNIFGGMTNMLKSKNRLTIVVFIIILVIVIFNMAMGAIGMLVSNVQNTVQNFTADISEEIAGNVPVMEFTGEGHSMLDSGVFLQDFSDMVAERAKAVGSEHDEQPEGEDFVEFYRIILEREIIEAEEIKEFSSPSLDDENLEYYIDLYIEGLYEQLSALDYYITDMSEFEFYWNYGYSLRAAAIVDLNEVYGLDIPQELIDDHQVHYDEIYSSLNGNPGYFIGI